MDKQDLLHQTRSRQERFQSQSSASDGMNAGSCWRSQWLSSNARKRSHAHLRQPKRVHLHWALTEGQGQRAVFFVFEGEIREKGVKDKGRPTFYSTTIQGLGKGLAGRGWQAGVVTGSG